MVAEAGEVTDLEAREVALEEEEHTNQLMICRMAIEEEVEATEEGLEGEQTEESMLKQ